VCCAEGRDVLIGLLYEMRLHFHVRITSLQTGQARSNVATQVLSSTSPFPCLSVSHSLKYFEAPLDN
jgi:hypothetical protein